MNFRVGQKAVCACTGKIGTPSSRYSINDLHGLKEGSIYTVRATGNDYRDNPPVIYLNEIIRPIISEYRRYGEVGYAAERFRPVVEGTTDISVFHQLLQDCSNKISIEDLLV